MVVILVTINILITWYLLTTFDLGTDGLFLLFECQPLSVVVVLVFLAQHQQQYMRIHYLLKLLILLGVFSIILLNPSLILSKLL